LYLGALLATQADLSEASELDPQDAYVALWLDIANERSSLPSPLAQTTNHINMGKWPAPILIDQTRFGRSGGFGPIDAADRSVGN
jgi:hypothetical protein